MTHRPIAYSGLPLTQVYVHCIVHVRRDDGLFLDTPLRGRMRLLLQRLMLTRARPATMMRRCSPVDVQAILYVPFINSFATSDCRYVCPA